MLHHLLIKDLAVVSHVDLSFDAGMTVITGETGAGKSILLDALTLVLGERFDSLLIRPGAERAEISATFDISLLPSAILWLNDLDLTLDDQSEQCIIRRVLYHNGRSRAFINGRPATTQQLRLLGEYLVQIHGQHQHQRLLKPSEQLRLLDAFGQHDATVSQVKTAYRACDQLLQAIQSLQENVQDRSRLTLLEYQIAELETLQLGEQELDTLHQTHLKLAHATECLETTQRALTIIEHPENTDVLSLLAKAHTPLKALALKFPALANIVTCIETASITLKEAALEMQHFLDAIENDPAQLAAIEHRLGQIHDLARKHKVAPEQLYAHLAHLRSQAEQYNQQSQQRTQLEQDLQLAKKQYQQCAEHLSTQRQQAAVKLSQAVTTGIAPLGMPGGIFTVNLLPLPLESLHATGNESVQFNLSANPGHPPAPLNKVASGGELSRVSLAIEVISAKFLATPCLIFDEVDVGISGKIGAMVGKTLHELSQNAQVLCITHLPQVAAIGDHHIQVTKTRSQESTTSKIERLDEPRRVEEIARMLGGLDTTTQARAHAKALLKVKDKKTLSLL